MINSITLKSVMVTASKIVLCLAVGALIAVGMLFVSFPFLIAGAVLGGVSALGYTGYRLYRYLNKNPTEQPPEPIIIPPVQSLPEVASLVEVQAPIAVISPVAQRISAFEQQYAEAKSQLRPVHHMLQLAKTATISDCIPVCSQQMCAWHENSNPELKAVYALDVKEPIRQKTHAIFTFWKTLYDNLKTARSENTWAVFPRMGEAPQPMSDNASSMERDLTRRYDHLDKTTGDLAHSFGNIARDQDRIARDQDRIARDLADMRQRVQNLIPKIYEGAMQQHYKKRRPQIKKYHHRWSLFFDPQTTNTDMYNMLLKFNAKASIIEANESRRRSF